jgi:GT2 family glycosyltransferase
MRLSSARPPISAIVVSYNSAAVLAGCLRALQEQLVPEELLVVDNASRDRSPAIAREIGAEVIANPSNSGFGAGCNRGARSAKSDLLLFVNPDVRVSAVDVSGLSDRLTARPFGLLAPRALLRDEGHLEHSLRRGLPWPCSVAREALGPVLPHRVARRLSASIDAPGRGAWLSGALLLCARAEFLELGGFDERLFLYYEDQELSRRYRMSGLPLTVTDAITGHHVRGGSSPADSELRPIPRAASALSSVEVVGICNGNRSLRIAWMLLKALRRCSVVWVALAGRGRLYGRASGKLDELQSTKRAIAALLGQPGPSYPQTKSLSL